MKIKQIFTLILLCFYTFLFSQNEVDSEEPNVFTKFRISYNLKNFNGNNFLSKAHNPNYEGLHFSVVIVEFKNFGLGGSYEINSSEVTHAEKVGNFNTMSLNHYAGFITYELDLAKSKFSVTPKFEIGDCKAKQKGDGFYAFNNGNYYGISSQINYNISEKFAVYTSIGYHFYTFKVKTSEEAKDFFNKSNAINISLGIQFL